MAAQKQDDQLERTFSSYVRIQVVVLKTYLGRWTIGRSGERGSGISVLPAPIWWLMMMICLDYVLRTSIDKIRENGFELTKKRSKRYPAKTITDADYADDLALLGNTPNQAETLLHSLERAAAGIGLHVNAHKTEYMCYNQTGNITTLDGASLRLVGKFTYLGSSVSSTENDIDTRLTKAWTAIDRLSIIWKSDLTDEMKRSFFQAAVVSILLYGCTTWTLTKRLEKKLDGNYTRMLRAILNKSWRQHPTRRQLYGHLPPITKTIQVRRARHAGHCWRSKDELVSDVLLWTPTYGQAKAGRPARTYIQQLCEDTGCNPEDLPEAMNDREKWREMVKDIRAGGTTWWWWWRIMISYLKQQYPTKKQRNGHLPPISQTVQVRRIRHTEHCWRGKDVLVWIPTQWCANVARPVKTLLTLDAV